MTDSILVGVEQIVESENKAHLQKILKDQKLASLKSEFKKDLRGIWRDYCKVKYGVLAPFKSIVIFNTLLFEVYYYTELLKHSEFWFNEKWKIKFVSGCGSWFRVEKIETGENFRTD